MTVHGSNGQPYTFVLKGHEDLRQDERVMQLFGLVNVLLQGNEKTFACDLSIQRYAVIPLSSNVGLVGWAPHADTLHQLIRDHRQARKVGLNIATDLLVLSRSSTDSRLTPLLVSLTTSLLYLSR